MQGNLFKCKYLTIILLNLAEYHIFSPMCDYAGNGDLNKCY